MKQGKLITLAIHTYEKAVILKTLLEKEGISAVLHNVNLIQPVISSGVRVRIHEEDLPMALKIIEASAAMNARTGGDEPVGKPVFVPVDFSEFSLKACRIGFALAQKMHSEVVVFHAYINRRYTEMLPFSSDEYADSPREVKSRDQAAREVERRVSEFDSLLKGEIAAGRLPEVHYTITSAEGVPEDKILTLAQDLDACIAVMGTRGRSQKSQDFMGSVTAEVLDAGKFPVLTVPKDATASQLRNVVFLSNMHQQDLLSLDAFARLFSFDHELHITIIPIAGKDGDIDTALESLVEYCRRHYPQYAFDSQAFDDDDFMDQFDQYIINNKTDLIVVPNKKRNIFARLFNPSVAHKMLFRADTPMLVVPV